MLNENVLRSTIFVSPFFSKLIFIELQCVGAFRLFPQKLPHNGLAITIVNSLNANRAEEFFFFIFLYPVTIIRNDHRSHHKSWSFFIRFRMKFIAIYGPCDLTNKPKFIVLWEMRNKGDIRPHAHTIRNGWRGLPSHVTPVSRQNTRTKSHNCIMHTDFLSFAAIICFRSFSLVRSFHLRKRSTSRQFQFIVSSNK